MTEDDTTTHLKTVFVSTSSEITPVSVSANGDDGNVPENTLDDDLSTRWSSQGDTGKYITYDLGSSQDVESVKIAWHKGDEREAYFKIRVGNSLSTLTTVYDAKQTGSSGNTVQLETYTFNKVNVRYVRISCFGNSSNDWNSITETKIFGSQDGSNDTYPYDLGLDRWKITLPRDFDGDERADEVYRDASENDYSQDPSFTVYDDQFFYVNNGYIRFECPATADIPTTSNNTTNTRTELREMPDSDNEDGWDANDSSLRTLHLKVRIVQTPNSKKLAFAQIHDFGQSIWDDLLRIQIQSDDANAGIGDTGRIYLLGDLIEGELSDGFDVDFRGQNYADRYIKNDYVLGDWLEVKITVENATVKVYLDNMSTPVRTYNDADCSSNYFKAGVYNQSISGNYGGAGIAEFEFINVSDNF